MMLISFTNFGAATGIPGLAQLVRQSRKVEQEQQELQDLKDRNGARLDRDDAETSPNGRRRRRSKQRDDDDDDEELRNLWRDLTATVQAGRQRVQSIVTPRAAHLEFHPTPEQLWSALQQGGRYRVPETLVVQLDEDDMDQSAPLATALVEAASVSSSSGDGVDMDVKFARLRGTHWTPVAVADRNGSSSSSSGQQQQRTWWQQVNLNQAGRLLLFALQGRKRSKQQEASLRELRQTMARYITEVVTKE